MNAREFVTHYHDETKHNFQRTARSLGYMDWDTQPDPFRRFQGAPLHRLPLRQDDPTAPYDKLYQSEAIEPCDVNLTNLGSFFELSLALAAWKEFGGSQWALRINPSSGNLHPTEAYLLAGPIDQLHNKPAVYHYAPKAHGLERRCEFKLDDWLQLTGDWPLAAFAVALTSVFWREAWKYGERAYRYCQHDVGHALAALSYSAALHGWDCRGVDNISDADISHLLGLDRDKDFQDAEDEHPDLLLLISRQRISDNVPLWTAMQEAVLENSQPREWFGRANRLSSRHVDWPIIDEISRACSKPRTSPRLWAESRPPSPVGAADARPLSALPAARVIRQRRSAVSMDGKTDIPADAFYKMMKRTMPSRTSQPFRTLGPGTHVHLLLFIHRVTGLRTGLYLLLRDPEARPRMAKAIDAKFWWSRPDGCPRDLPLFQLAGGHLSRLATQLSCVQDIAGEGAFSLGMLAEFDDALKEHGSWFYRRLFWEAGAIGQVLYLEAEAAGVRATGIGCYFDDPVHDVVGLQGHTFQSMYHFTVGGAIEDLRLMTHPPYAGLREDED